LELLLLRNAKLICQVARIHQYRANQHLEKSTQVHYYVDLRASFWKSVWVSAEAPRPNRRHLQRVPLTAAEPAQRRKIRPLPRPQ